MQTKVRVVGSGFTVLHWRGNAIAWLDSFQDSGVRAQGGGGQGWEAITPLGWRRPREIVTSRVLGAGTLTLSIKELWNRPVWQQLQGLARADNLLDVWEALAADDSPVSCQMIINPPGSAGPKRRKVYHNCVITQIPDAETVEVGSLSVSKSISVVYTHTTG